MTRRTLTLMAVLAVLLLALPLTATAQDTGQDPDPYGEVLPREIERDGTVTPTAQTPAPPVPSGTLPATGSSLTVGLLLLGVALLTMGTAAVLATRRRARSSA